MDRSVEVPKGPNESSRAILALRRQIESSDIPEKQKQALLRQAMSVEYGAYVRGLAQETGERAKGVLKAGWEKVGKTKNFLLRTGRTILPYAAAAAIFNPGLALSVGTTAATTVAPAAVGAAGWTLDAFRSLPIAVQAGFGLVGAYKIGKSRGRSAERKQTNLDYHI